MKTVYGNVDLLYTMGQPRVGNSEFVNSLNSQIVSYYRIVNYADIVVHSPPKAFAFRHAGR